MPAKYLHGEKIEKAATALILIDVINDFDFPEASELLKQAIPAAHCIRKLKAQAKAAGMPVIYANDNFGRWRSDFTRLVKHCLAPESRGRPVAELLKPEADDYFVLKPKHSGFYCTALEILLDDLGVRTVILTGFATNICVLFTANDAYLRDLTVIVPRDCVGANTVSENDAALSQIRRILKANTHLHSKLDLKKLSCHGQKIPRRRKPGGSHGASSKPR
ncbi:MAG TPA: isochorismatase family cysteine hydrolase [Pirellulales bacterium]|jgi:nicotinamidase-related amidase|nr:isochorismatase family cysteine hydrolase [Pirellulales bacterium]